LFLSLPRINLLDHCDDVIDFLTHAGSLPRAAFIFSLLSKPTCFSTKLVDYKVERCFLVDRISELCGIRGLIRLVGF
jgi:hypothetical protein